MRKPEGLTAAAGCLWGFWYTVCPGRCRCFQQMQMIMCDLSANWNNSYRELEQRILSMEQKLDELSRCFHQTSELLSQVLLRRNPEIRWRRRVDVRQMWTNTTGLLKMPIFFVLFCFVLGGGGCRWHGFRFQTQWDNYLQRFHQNPQT